MLIMNFKFSQEKRLVLIKKRLTLGFCIALSLILSVSGVLRASAVEAQRLGDVDGDDLVNAQDVLLVLQHSVGIVSLNPTQRVAADVT